MPSATALLLVKTPTMASTLAGRFAMRAVHRTGFHPVLSILRPFRPGYTARQFPI